MNLCRERNNTLSSHHRGGRRAPKSRRKEASRNACMNNRHEQARCLDTQKVDNYMDMSLEISVPWTQPTTKKMKMTAYVIPPTGARFRSCSRRCPQRILRRNQGRTSLNNSRHHRTRKSLDEEKHTNERTNEAAIDRSSDHTNTVALNDEVGTDNTTGHVLDGNRKLAAVGMGSRLSRRDGACRPGYRMQPKTSCW